MVNSMHSSCWSVLGIAPTDDVRSIKRAYLGRLKSIKPDEDIEGFQSLRAAYEQAQALAAQPQGGFDAAVVAVFEATPASNASDAAATDDLHQGWHADPDVDNGEWQDGFAARREEWLCGCRAC